MAKKKNSISEQSLKIGSPEIGMLGKNDFSEDELEAYLNQGEIKASDKPQVPPQILWVGDCTIATFGNFSASTGKAKSKKTFNISAMVAAAITNSTILNYRASLPEGKRKILYFDTEQSRYHCHNVVTRIYRLANLSMKREDKRIKFFGLREFTPTLRIALIDYALRTIDGVGLVIIDGLRDLMYDINNAKESTDVMTMLMAWTSKYDLHIHCVLHLNKNDNNTRGHIGTELENKAETVLVISKNKQDANISEVKAMHIRDRDFSPFAFRINDDALPELVRDYTFDQPRKDRTFPLNELSEQEHRQALEAAFGNNVIQGYPNIIAALKTGYASIGYERGRNKLVDLRKFLENKRMIIPEGKGWRYNPDFVF